MRIDPIVARLRRDPSPQLRAQAALEAVRDSWREDAWTAAVLADLTRYAAGGLLADYAVLAHLLQDADRARAFVDPLLARLSATLRTHPLGHVPLRHHYGRGLAVLQLVEAGGAALALVTYEGGADGRAAAVSVCFAGGERHEVCLAGSAEVGFFEVVSEEPHCAVLDCVTRSIAPGDVMQVSGPRHARIVQNRRESLVVLRLSRPDPVPAPAREFRIADGALVHRASGDRAESRDEMAAAVLGAMRRGDAAPVLAKLTRSGASAHLRWQAVCQALALDTAAGFNALTALARDHGEALAAPARALRASLIARYPALADGDVPCPA